MTEEEKGPALFQPPNGFLFEATIRLESGETFIVYLDSFSESLATYNIPLGVQDVYPDAPFHMELNPNQLAALTVRVVPGMRMMKKNEFPIPPHTVNGEVPF